MSERRRAYFAWLIVCFAWGTTYLGIRIGLETIPPFLLAGCRWIAAGALILVVLKARGELLPRARGWGQLATLGFFLLTVGNGGVTWAEQTVPSGLTAVLVATAPFWMVGVEALMPDGEPLTAKRMLGLIVGFTGILVLVWPEVHVGSGGGGFIGGVIAAQLACFGWAVGSSYSRRHAREENVLANAALQMVFGGLILIAAATLRREWNVLSFNARTTGALIYLTLVGGIGGFSAYAYALKHLPVSFVSLYAYVNPVIAVALGTLVLNEPFGFRTTLGAGIVLVGIAFVRDD